MLSGFGPSVSGLGFNAHSWVIYAPRTPVDARYDRGAAHDGLHRGGGPAAGSEIGAKPHHTRTGCPSGIVRTSRRVGEGEKPIPALLAGGWDSRQDGDKAILAELAGLGSADNYPKFEASLRGFLERHDFPLDREAGIPAAAGAGRRVSQSIEPTGVKHPTLLAKVTEKVFSVPPPRNGPTNDFGVSKASHSSRRGKASPTRCSCWLHCTRKWNSKWASIPLCSSGTWWQT